MAYCDGLVVADKGVKRRILEMVQNLPAGDPGQQKTREIISRDFFWCKMAEDANEFIKVCL